MLERTKTNSKSSTEKGESNNLLVTRIVTMLHAGYNGGAWHGPSVMEALKDLSPEQASFKTPTVHTIAELIYHMTSWRLFVIKRLQGDYDYLIDDDKKDFGNSPVVDKFELETLLMELSLSQDELVKELVQKTDTYLDQIVPGSEYTYYTLVHGIIQHDIYHAGQVSILKKMYNASDESEESGDIFSEALG